MKKFLQITLLTLLVAFFSTLKIQAQKSLIHYWHFNNTLPAGGGGGTNYKTFDADFSTIGNASITWRGVAGVVADTGRMDNVAGDTINERPGYGGCCSGGTPCGIRTRNPSDSMEFVWYIPTTGYKNILITYETESSSTTSGQFQQHYSYSLNGGATYSTAGLPVTYDSAGTAWGETSLDLSAITDANNNSQFVLRITYQGNNTGASGNNRFDNITIEGDSMVTGIEEEMANHGYNIYPNPANQVLNVQSAFAGSKVIAVYNSLGQMVYSSINEGKRISLDIMSLSSGIYCLNIKQTNGNNNYSIKFIKN